MRWTKRLKRESWVCLPDPAADQEAAWNVRSKHVQERVRLCIVSSWTEKAQEEIPSGIPAPRLGNPFISSWCSFPLAASLVSKTPSANDTVRWIRGITYSKNLLRIYTGCSSSCWIQIQYPYCCQHWNKRKVLLSEKTGKRNHNKSCATAEYLWESSHLPTRTQRLGGREKFQPNFAVLDIGIEVKALFSLHRGAGEDPHQSQRQDLSLHPKEEKSISHCHRAAPGISLQSVTWPVAGTTTHSDILLCCLLQTQRKILNFALPLLTPPLK